MSKRIIRAVFATVINAEGDEPEIVINTGAVDRVGDIVVPEGAVLDAYRGNPVVLFAHDHRELPVGSTTSISVQADGIRAKWRWLEGDQRASRVRNAFEQGILRAASVGFVPLAEEPAGGRGGGTKFTKWELLEWSLCAVPANPEAVRVLRGLGLNVARQRGAGSDPDRPDNDTSGPPTSVVRARVELEEYLASLSDDDRALAQFNPIRTAISALTAFLERFSQDKKRLAAYRGVRDAPADPIVLVLRDDEEELVIDPVELQKALTEGVRAQIDEAIMQLTGRVD